MKDRRLLHRLFSGGAKSELAWKEFLGLYSNLFLSIIAKYTKVHDEAMAKYLFICSHLCKDNFHILKKFITSSNFRKPKLSTWLTVVVRNLCVDEFRSNHGRQRIPSAIQSLNDFDICIFKLRYWFGYKDTEICHIFSNLKNGNEKVMGSIYRISNLLKNSRVGNYKNFDPIFIELDESKFILHNSDADLDELSERISNSISKLKPIQNMVLQLRFWEGLSPEKISTLLKISKRQVYTILKLSIKTLKIDLQNNANM